MVWLVICDVDLRMVIIYLVINEWIKREINILWIINFIFEKFLLFKLLFFLGIEREVVFLKFFE